MEVIKNEYEYIHTFEKLLTDKGIKNYPNIELYFENIKKEYLTFSQSITTENYWNPIFELLSLDEKLVILNEGLHYMQIYGMEETDLITMIENDYMYCNQENAGFLKNECPYFSMIFPTFFKR